MEGKLVTSNSNVALGSFRRDWNARKSISIEQCVPTIFSHIQHRTHILNEVDASFVCTSVVPSGWLKLHLVFASLSNVM